MPWLVAVSKPNHESIAGSHLARQGFTYWYPQYLVKKPLLKPVARPLFPRYIFIFAESVWRSLSGTRGISYILMGDNGPKNVADSLIAGLKARCSEDGLYQLAKPSRFNRGDIVKAEVGSFAGLPMIYEGMTSQERVSCLLEMMGRKTLIEINESALVAA